VILASSTTFESCSAKHNLMATPNADQLRRRRQQAELAAEDLMEATRILNLAMIASNEVSKDSHIRAAISSASRAITRMESL
jgi:spore coat polysaccharide biosynthesis predicted glycosyltransferase SpsG